ncbi:MAG: hypothetical protein ACTHXA_13000 [Gulosibacter sp.]|uniref:hypothetical protein n=1 Tax=Gulosibacter sp. TaxID=2817531 RepID=UPI003F90A8CB
MIIAIDGRSGSGKSTLAGEVIDRIGGQLIHVEDFYPGWGGLESGAVYLASQVLKPLRQGERVATPRWDWHSDVFRDGDVIEPRGLIVVEGCGALSRASRPLLDFAVWLEAAPEFRRARATERDGDDRWWAGWAAQEDAFYERERSPQLADLQLSADGDAEELIARLRTLAC